MATQTAQPPFQRLGNLVPGTEMWLTRAVWAVRAQLGCGLFVILDRTRGGKGSKMAHNQEAGRQVPAFPKLTS